MASTTPKKIIQTDIMFVGELLKRCVLIVSFSALILQDLSQTNYGALGLTALSAKKTTMHELTSKLLADYEDNVIPTEYPLRPKGVTPLVSLLQVINLDGAKGTFSFNANLMFFWNDDYLKWTPASYDGISTINLPKSKVWIPKVGVTNSVNADDFDLSGSANNWVQIEMLGSVKSIVLWQRQKVYTTTCNIDMKFFPFDIQTCTIKIRSLTSSSLRLTLTQMIAEVMLDHYETSSEWEFISSYANSSNEEIVSTLQFTGMSSFSLYTVVIRVRRRSEYYVTHLILPCIFLSILVTVTFLMPSEAGEKVSFSVTLLLAFTVYQMVISDTLPKSSDSTPILSIYLTIMIAMASAAVICVILILNVYHHDPNKSLPIWMQRLVFSCLGLLTFKAKSVRELVLDDQTSTVALDQQNKIHPGGAGDRKMNEGALSIQSLGNVTECFRALGHGSGGNFASSWKLAAEILDRVCMFVFILIQVVSSVVLLYIMPNYFMSLPEMSSYVQ